MKPKRWVRVKSCNWKCPYCGCIQRYPEEECNKCGHDILEPFEERGG